MEASGTDLARVSQQFEERHLADSEDEEGIGDSNHEFFLALLEGALEHQVRIDKLTDSVLVEKWPINRIDPTLRALFRAAGAELILAKSPTRVTINEFVEVAKAFYLDGKTPKFVNAVLDKMARDITVPN